MVKPPTPRRAQITATAVLIILAAAVAAGCGGGDDDVVALSPLAEEGRQIVASSGCASCHGQDGSGTVGPAWRGLVGSEVTLDDGSVITADAAYIRQSIVDPDAQVVAGYTVRMPENALTATEVDRVVAYIEELG